MEVGCEGGCLRDLSSHQLGNPANSTRCPACVHIIMNRGPRQRATPETSPWTPSSAAVAASESSRQPGGATCAAFSAHLYAGPKFTTNLTLVPRINMLAAPQFVVREVPGGQRSVAGIDWRFNAWGGQEGGLYSSWQRDDAVAGRILQASRGSRRGRGHHAGRHSSGCSGPSFGAPDTERCCPAPSWQLLLGRPSTTWPTRAVGALQLEGARRFECNIVMEGGSIHVDGEGTLLTTGKELGHALGECATMDNQGERSGQLLLPLQWHRPELQDGQSLKPPAAPAWGRLLTLPAD